MPRKSRAETESKERIRVRLDADIEQYLLSQSERVLSKQACACDGTDLSTLTNRLLYEHKQAQQVAKALPLARFFNSLMTWLSGGSGKVVALNHQAETQALSPSEPSPDDFEFDADLGDLYEHEAA